jgi:hypothetical protein
MANLEKAIIACIITVGINAALPASGLGSRIGDGVKNATGRFAVVTQETLKNILHDTKDVFGNTLNKASKIADSAVNGMHGGGQSQLDVQDALRKATQGTIQRSQQLGSPGKSWQATSRGSIPQVLLPKAGSSWQATIAGG